MVAVARSQLGKPYVAGGASPETGFDCSGFTCWVYNQYGIPLPRRSYDQFNIGTKVSKDQLRAGDLVFFDVSRKGADHVGIYTGRRTFIHCPHSGAKVREDGFYDTYWQQHFIGACRILP
jgi:cell wall-associated NlpC family hydrolase